MDEKRVKEEEKRPETREGAPAGEKLDDRELDGAAGGYFLDTRNPRGDYA